MNRATDDAIEWQWSESSARAFWCDWWAQRDIAAWLDALSFYFILFSAATDCADEEAARFDGSKFAPLGPLGPARRRSTYRSSSRSMTIAYKKSARFLCFFFVFFMLIFVSYAGQHESPVARRFVNGAIARAGRGLLIWILLGALLLFDVWPGADVTDEAGADKRARTWSYGCVINCSLRLIKRHEGPAEFNYRSGAWCTRNALTRLLTCFVK